jgi:two-component system, NtrC family, sensor histidine kinase KinB
MKLKTQIFFGYLFILLLTITLTGIMLYYLEGLGRASEKLLKENYRTVKATEELILSLSKMDQMTSKLILGGKYNEDVLFSILFNEEKVFRSNLKICDDEANTQAEADLIDDIKADFENYFSSIERQGYKEDGIYLSVLQQKNTSLREKIARLSDLNHKALYQKYSSAQSFYYNARTYIIIFLIFVLFLASLAAYNIPERITKPIHELTEKIKSLAAGEYGQKLEVTSNNELGELIHSFNVMSLKIKNFQDLNISKIQAQKSRMETIINYLHDGLIVFDEFRKAILVNEKALSVLGMEDDGLVGKSIHELSAENGVMQEILLAINKAENQNQDETLDTSNFIKVTSPEGKSEFYTKEIIKVYDNKDTAGRKFVGYIVTLKDVTLFKRSDEAKNNFLSVVSHELKTPLSAMNMSLMLLQDDRFGSLNSEQFKIASSMKQEVQRLIKMVGELLDLSKVESGNIELQKKLVKADEVVEKATTLIMKQIKNKKIKLVTDLEASLPELNIDLVKVSWVLHNFLSNAVRFTPEGGTIVLKVSNKDSYAEFVVEDEGPGLKQENISKIFNKFVQLPELSNKEKGGLGLGLAISKEVIEEHGGEIGVISSLGIGSRFYFKLPFEVVEDNTEKIA